MPLKSVLYTPVNVIKLMNHLELVKFMLKQFIINIAYYISILQVIRRTTLTYLTRLKTI